jgi:hypothetical protein
VYLSNEHQTTRQIMQQSLESISVGVLQVLKENATLVATKLGRDKTYTHTRTQYPPKNHSQSALDRSTSSANVVSGLRLNKATLLFTNLCEDRYTLPSPLPPPLQQLPPNRGKVVRPYEFELRAVLDREVTSGIAAHDDTHKHTH